jgi:NAD(P)-dependent dehydrogenase (short-subunit alcohol dehydrogenase family)
MSAFDLTGSVAVVTGGGQGLGKAMALALAEAGADIAIVARRPEAVSGRGASRPHEPAEPALEEIKLLGRRCLAVTADLREPDQVDRMVQEVLAAFGRIDILVNNAGGSWGETFQTGPLLEVTAQDLDETFRLNVKNVFLCSKAVALVMKEQGKGSIINISSSAGRHSIAGRGLYGAAKAAVIHLTQTMALEWGPEVRVNAVVPGSVANLHRSLAPGTEQQINQQIGNIALGRLGMPEEFAGTVVYLASDASSFTSGAIIDINGGPIR